MNLVRKFRKIENKTKIEANRTALLLIVKKRKTKKMKLRFVLEEKNEYDHSSTIEDLPLLAVTVEIQWSR